MSHWRARNLNPATSSLVVPETCGDSSPSFIPASDRARFLSKVGPIDANGCRLWLGKCRGFGYGCINLNGRGFDSHRAAWLVMVGPIPAGMHVLHKCDVPACVNPDHLFLGTHAENVADMDAKGRRPIGARAPQAKLNDAAVIEMISRHKGGEGMVSLSRAFGVSHGSVSKIIRGLSWKHVSREVAAGAAPLLKKSSAFLIRAARAMSSSSS